MFENLKLPKKITPSPIAEAVFEIRFTSDIPGTALCGMFYPVISKIFPGTSIDELPILQLPPVVRDNDPNLKFQPHYRLIKDNFIFAFGPTSISFSCIAPYSGWEQWSNFFLSIIDGLANIETLKNIKINRLGLRYIDHIDGNLFENTKTTICISDTSLASSNTQLHSEFTENDILIILNMMNGMKQINKESFSVFDIDCVKSCNSTFDSFRKDIIETGFLNDLHETNKRYFFGLLKDDFLAKLNPEL
mgnify:CR=1 FL=1